MINDSLTITSWVVSILVIILVFGMIFYSHLTMKKNLKITTRNTILMHADDEIRDLCKKIMAIDPNSCPLVDGGAIKLIQADPEKLKSILREHLKTLQT